MKKDDSTDCWGEAEESSVGEYNTADDGYEADVEVLVKNHQDLTPRRISQLAGISEITKGSVDADPALCSLAIDLLIYFSQQ